MEYSDWTFETSHEETIANKYHNKRHRIATIGMVAYIRKDSATSNVAQVENLLNFI